jgi:hypothetical protein
MSAVRACPDDRPCVNSCGSGPCSRRCTVCQRLAWPAPVRVEVPEPTLLGHRPGEYLGQPYATPEEAEAAGRAYRADLAARGEAVPTVPGQPSVPCPACPDVPGKVNE